MARIKLLVLVTFFLSLAACSAKEALSIYDTIPKGRTASSTSSFQLIDDFNGGIGPTKFGTDWKVLGTEKSKVHLAQEEEDGVNHGRSLLVEYSIAAGETARFFAPLKGLDMSRADFLVFLARQKELDAFGGKILIGLRDVSGKTVTTDVRSYMKRLWSGPRSAWVQVAIPKTEYRSLDFNQLERLEIALTAGDQKISGNLVLDEISFFGPSELVFRSNADNLKGFPKTVVWDGRVRELMQIQNDHKLIQAVARDTWQYFENLIDRQTGLPVDHIRVGEALGIGAYVSPTNLGLYWIATVAAFDLSLISKEEAIANIRLSFASFKKLNHWGVGYYNYYQTRSFGVTREYVSVVDNGWLAAALVVIRQAFPEEFGKEASEALKKLDFSEFYDSSNGQLRLGFDADKGDFSPYHYGLLATEARLASYVAIGKGDLGKEHWARIYRTLPAEWDWQKQTPQGSVRELFGVPVFEGFYTYLGKQFVPSWGGSLFEFLAPTLLLKEQELAPKGLGKNNEIATDLQIQHALQERGYPVWGLAPCATRNGKYWVYREYGVPALGAKGYADRGVIAPYVSFLALATRPQAAIQNLREMLLRYPGIYGEYGFYDAVDLSNGAVNPQYLALDQAMSFLAMANYLKDGAVRKRFHADPVGKQGEELLKEEIFSLN